MSTYEVYGQTHRSTSCLQTERRSRIQADEGLANGVRANSTTLGGKPDHLGRRGEVSVTTFTSKIGTGNVETFVQQLSQYIPRVFKVVRAILENRDDAEDIVQEAAIVAFRSIQNLRNEQAFGSWFLRIAVNKAKDTLRRRKREDERFRALSHISDLNHKTEPEKKIDVVQAVKELPVNHRSVIRLYYAGGYSTVEIAEMLRRPEGTIRRILSESYKMLRQSLAPGF